VSLTKAANQNLRLKAGKQADNKIGPTSLSRRQPRSHSHARLAGKARLHKTKELSLKTKQAKFNKFIN